MNIRTLAFVGLAFATSMLSTAVFGATEPPRTPMRDNSFLLEEAYNQDPRVVQHVQRIQINPTTDAWTYSFEQRWPIFGRNHQLSYELPIGRSRVGNTPNLGDVQLLESTNWAIAPRIGIIAPTGDFRQGMGYGTTGIEFNLPISRRMWGWLSTHWNIGVTVVPNASNAAGDRANVVNYHINKSFAWLASDRWNVMLEMLSEHRRQIEGPGKTVSRFEFVFSPGVRHAVNLSGGTQIVPGLSVPMTILSRDGFKWGVLAYLSIENPY